MTYPLLYQFAQSQQIPISRRVFLEKVSELANQPRQIQIMESGMDPEVIRGLFIMPGTTSHPLARFCDGVPLIILARNQNRCWKRFVCVKELMHLFDTALERVSNPEEFASLLAEMGTQLPERSAAMDSEIAGFWLAAGVLCPELKRQEFQRERQAGKLTDHDIAMQLRIPEQYVPRLFDPNFKAIIQSLLDICK